MKINKYNEFVNEVNDYQQKLIDNMSDVGEVNVDKGLGKVVNADYKLSQRAKFKKGDKVEWSEGDSEWYTIDYSFVDNGIILYNLRNPEGISSGGRVREDELSIVDDASENIESKINIVDTINRDDIEGNVQTDAKYGMLNPSGKFIQKFYRIKNVKFNDETNKDVLQYWGEQGGWHNSSYNYSDIDKLKDNKFLEII